MIVLGLTGSIGMGKSTTARMFAEAGVPVHDSDETVHRLYAGKAAPLIEAAFSGVASGGAIDRTKLSRRVLGDAAALKRLEKIIHPLVRADADAFVASHRAAGAPLIVLDIPLLFETGGQARVDKIAVVSSLADVQRRRVMARPGMTAQKFESILARQVPDADKRAQADFVIDTGLGLNSARLQVNEIVASLIGKNA